MTAVRRLNHAVLYVRDARRSAAFYREALGFEVVGEFGDGAAIFMRAAETDNHHDLGLFSIGAQAPGPEQGRAGLYHLAWEVDTIQDLAAMRERLLGRRRARRRERSRREQVAVRARPRRHRVRGVVDASRAKPGATSSTTRSSQRLDLPAELARWG